MEVGSGIKRYDKSKRKVVSTSIRYFPSLKLKIMTMKKDYVFKQVDGIDIKATVHWKAPKTEAENSYGIGVSGSS